MNAYGPLSCTRFASMTLRAWAASVVLLHAAAVLAQQDTPLSLEEAVRLAAEQSRQIAAAQAQARAAREMGIAARQRPDPVLKLGINNLPVEGTDRFSIARDFMTMRSIGVMQEFTRSEKLAARATKATREADAAVIAEHQITADLQRDTALAWLELSFQQSVRELIARHTIEADRQAQAAEVLYRNGRGSQADVFSARAEVETLKDRMDQIDRALATAAIQLERWVGKAAERPAGPRPSFSLPTWTEDILTRHLATHPPIAAAVQSEALAQAEVAVAQANRESDWSVELMFSQRGSSYANMVSFNLSVPLQWDRKHRQDRELAAARALAERATAERENRERAHEAEIRTMLQEWRSHEQRLARYDSSLSTLSKQRIEAALTAYRTGTGNLASVLAARRADLDTQLERLRIEMDIARLWAQATYLVPLTNGDGIIARRQP